MPEIWSLVGETWQETHVRRSQNFNQVYLKINDFSKKICVLSILLFRGTSPFSLPRGFHCCDLTVGIYLTGGPASWDGDTIKMPGMQVPPVVFGLRDGRCAFRGVPRGQIFSGFSQRRRLWKKGKVLGFRVGVSPSLWKSRWPGVKFLAMDSFYLGGWNLDQCNLLKYGRGGGFKYFWNFHPENWGRCSPILTFAYFSFRSWWTTTNPKCSLRKVSTVLPPWDLLHPPNFKHGFQTQKMPPNSEPSRFNFRGGALPNPKNPWPMCKTRGLWRFPAARSYLDCFDHSKVDFFGVQIWASNNAERLWRRCFYKNFVGETWCETWNVHVKSCWMFFLKRCFTFFFKTIHLKIY